MLYSKTAQYAIQAMIYLAENGGSGFTGIVTIAESCGISDTSLGQIVQKLIRHRLLNSQRGIGGGVQLASPADEISLLEIVNVIDGPYMEQEQCVIGLDRCNNEAVCPLHEEWLRIRNLIQATLNQQSLADLAEGMRAKRQQVEVLPSLEVPVP